MDASVNFFKSDANYKNGGSKENLPGGFSYELTEVYLSGRYLISDSFAVSGGFNVGNSVAKDSLKTLTNSTVNWVQLGGDYLIYDDGMNISIDATVQIPIEKVSDTMDTSLNSDGALHFIPRAIISKELGIFTPYAYLGLDWRDQGLSTSALYGGGAKLGFGSAEIGAEVNAYSAVVNDKYTNEAAKRETIINSFNASSKKFYSINPSGVDTEFYLRYHASENWMLQVGGGLTLTGSESAAGYHAGALVRFLLPTSGKFTSSNQMRTRPATRQRPAAQPVKKQKQFEDEIEDEMHNNNVDGNYFEPIETSDENSYVEPLDSQAEKLQQNNYEDASTEEYKLNLKKKKPKKRN